MHFPKLSLTIAAALAVSSCGFKHKKYENPITAQTQQPDKVLFDKAIKDIEKGRYEIARITLNTLINTYESSEFLAKSQLAIADGATHFEKSASGISARLRGVSMIPGSTALTVTPWSLSSSARLSVSLCTPAFDAV